MIRQSSMVRGGPGGRGLARGGDGAPEPGSGCGPRQKSKVSPEWMISTLERVPTFFLNSSGSWAIRSKVL